MIDPGSMISHFQIKHDDYLNIHPLSLTFFPFPSYAAAGV